MAAMARYRFSMLTRQFPNMSGSRRLKSQSPVVVSFTQNQPIRFQHTKVSNSILHIPHAGGGGDGNNGVGRSGGGGGGGKGDDHSNSNTNDNSSNRFGILGLFLSGWRDRVAADPQFPFKVLMEELVGVTACVLGDMASRPNFGLDELDFVFSTLIVGSILNFTLMYLLAPTASASSSSLPAIFSNCPQSHMFESGLVGTAISNGLIQMKKKMDPSFETPNKPPPTLLNALTWATHMGISSNLRYQTLNGVEFLLAKGVSPLVFKSSVVVLRGLNNILGGMSFVILARMTGSQSVEEKPAMVEVGSDAEKEKFVDGGDNLETNQSTYK
ncbi:hypothetical protein REPUB_Repub20aG0002700 [Reevesia pubescens]